MEAMPSGPWSTYSLVGRWGTYGTRTVLSESLFFSSRNALWHSLVVCEFPEWRRDVRVGRAFLAPHVGRNKLDRLEKRFNLVLVLGCGPGLDVSDFLRVGRHSLLGEDVAEPHDGLLAELALLFAQTDAVLEQPLEQGPEVVVVFSAFPVDHDVVLDLDYTLESPQDVCHRVVALSRGSWGPHY